MYKYLEQVFNRSNAEHYFFHSNNRITFIRLTTPAVANEKYVQLHESFNG